MQKPFSFRGMNKKQRIFNYRLSRARRVLENAFGILANRFRCLLTTICLKKKNVESVVLTACILHNLISYRKYCRVNVEVDSEDASHQVVPGSWRNEEAVTAWGSLDCGEPPWPRGSELGLRPPGLEFRILCLEDSVISIISPSSGGFPGPA